MREDMLERLLATSKKWKNAQMVYADYYYVDVDGRITGRTPARVLDYRHLLVGNPGNMAFLYTKQAKDYGGNYSITLEGTEDWDMWLRISEKYIFAYLPEPLYFFREHEASMTSTMQPAIKASATRTAKAALARKGGSLALFHLFPGLLDCKTDRIAMGLAHTMLGSLLLQASSELGFEAMAVGVLEAGSKQLPSLPSAQLNYGAGLVQKWLRQGKSASGKAALEAHLTRLQSPALQSHIQSKGVYIASLSSLVSFLKGTNSTPGPYVIEEATMEAEIMAIPVGAIDPKCGESLFPFLIEASPAPGVSSSGYHLHVGKGAGGCMQGCQGIRQRNTPRQGESMMTASRHCRRICQAPGFPSPGHCAIQQGPPPTTPARADGLSPAAEASHRIIWTGGLTVGADYMDGERESPRKIGLQLRGRDIADAGQGAAQEACIRHALAPEVCETMREAMANATRNASMPAGEDLDLEFEEGLPLEGGGGDSAPPVVSLVTASSHHFFPRLLNLVGSIHFWQGPSVDLIVYDIGLTPEERDEIKRWSRVSLRTLPWAERPSHVGRDLYSYAWKPLVIQDALKRCRGPGGRGKGKGILLYQDAGQELRQPLDGLLSLVSKEGYLFPSAGVPASTTAHPTTLRALHTSKAELDQVPMALGGSMAIQCGPEGHEAHQVIDSVVSCALDEHCISPPGATTSNHAFDQVVLSVHLHQAGIIPREDWRWMAHDEAFYRENGRSYKMPLANNRGSFKQVTPGDAVLYTQRQTTTTEQGGGKTFADAIRRKC